MPRTLIAPVLAAAMVAGCASHAADPALPHSAQPSSKAVEHLRRDLQALFDAPAVDHAQWGINIVSLRSNETLYSYNPRRLLLPASNQKLLTAAVAAARLGWDYRFTTRILATGAIDPDGTLNGHLVVVGNGDPTINPRHAERWSVFDKWAADLRSRGIRIVNGDVIGDDDAFDEPGWGQGWSWDNLQYGYGTAVGALQYNENQLELLVGPGAEPGVRAIISSSPAGHGLLIDHGVTTARADSESTVDIERVPGSTVLKVRGQVAANAKPISITASVANPTLFYVSELKEALGRHGIFVSGPALDIDDLRQPLDLTHSSELVVDRSPPLSEIIDVCLKWSRNEYAETLLRALPSAGQPADAAAGLEIMRAQLANWGIPSELYLARDGSGLSRQDYISPEALTRLLAHMSADPKLAERFRSSLPVAGVSGSLAERMKGTAAENHVWAKTGTLSNVRSLSGYTETSTGEPIAFAMLANNFSVSTDEIDRTMEMAVLRVIELRR